MEILRGESAAEAVISEVAYAAVGIGDIRQIAYGVIGICGGIVVCPLMFNDLREVTVGVVGEVFVITLRVGGGRNPLVIGVRGGTDRGADRRDRERQLALDRGVVAAEEQLARDFC